MFLVKSKVVKDELRLYHHAPNQEDGMAGVGAAGGARPEADALVLRASRELQGVPAEGDVPGPGAVASPAAPAASASETAPQPVPAASAPPPPPPPPAPAPPADRPPPAPAAATSESGFLTWGMGSAALLASVGWVLERRRRRLLEMEKDSVMWADRMPNASIITTAGDLDRILPDSPDPAEAARAIYVTAIGETNSRREATLIDLHQLHGKLRRRRDRGDNVSAILLLQQHLVDFRYTSPWVFLELLELYRLQDRQVEWETARQAFRQRFGQNAPVWNSPTTGELQLVDDEQLTHELSQYWPYREARMFILRWMLGDPEMRTRGSGPPLLGLGVYRDLMLLDNLLDDVVVVRTQPADSLL